MLQNREKKRLKKKLIEPPETCGRIPKDLVFVLSEMQKEKKHIHRKYLKK